MLQANTRLDLTTRPSPILYVPCFTTSQPQSRLRSEFWSNTHDATSLDFSLNPGRRISLRSQKRKLRLSTRCTFWRKNIVPLSTSKRAICNMWITSAYSMRGMDSKTSQENSKLIRTELHIECWPICIRRHLLRLWLRDPENAWKTPEPLEHRWDTVYKDLTVDEQTFPLEPAIRRNVGS